MLNFDNDALRDVLKEVCELTNTVITLFDDNKNDVYISLPCVINENRIKEKVFVTLNENETYKLQNSINIIKDTIQNVK